MRLMAALRGRSSNQAKVEQPAYAGTGSVPPCRYKAYNGIPCQVGHVPLFRLGDKFLV